MTGSSFGRTQGSQQSQKRGGSRDRVLTRTLDALSRCKADDWVKSQRRGGSRVGPRRSAAGNPDCLALSDRRGPYHTRAARSPASGSTCRSRPPQRRNGPATAATESRERDEVEYPEGHWTAQSVWHGDAVMQAAMALRHHFRGREDVLVAMELVIYYKRGDNTARLQPDVQVVFGVGRGDRGTYKVWEEGKAPDFVLEVASPSTAENDGAVQGGGVRRDRGCGSTGGWTRRAP